MQFTAEIPDPKFEIGEEFIGGFGKHYTVIKRVFVLDAQWFYQPDGPIKLYGTWYYTYRNPEGYGSKSAEWYLKKIPQNTEEAIR